MWFHSTIVRGITSVLRGNSHVAIQVPGAIVGSDFAGTVVKISDNLTSNLSVGDKVAGCVHGGQCSSHISHFITSIFARGTEG